MRGAVSQLEITPDWFVQAAGGGWCLCKHWLKVHNPPNPGRTVDHFSKVSTELFCLTKLRQVGLFVSQWVLPPCRQWNSGAAADVTRC